MNAGAVAPAYYLTGDKENGKQQTGTTRGISKIRRCHKGDPDRTTHIGEEGHKEEL